MVEMAKKVSWYCVSCSKILGEVLGSELTLAGGIGGENVQTRGPNLCIKCPDCGSKKIWYTSDPIVRAMYQLVDSISSVAARRMITAVAEEMREIAKADKPKA